jgi:hypothetical protein
VLAVGPETGEGPSAEAAYTSQLWTYGATWTGEPMQRLGIMGRYFPPAWRDGLNGDRGKRMMKRGNPCPSGWPSRTVLLQLWAVAVPSWAVTTCAKNPAD